MSEKSKYLFFSMGPEDFGIPLLKVREVIAIPEITPVPQSPSYFLGLMNLRGQVLSVIDLRKKLNLSTSKVDELSVVVLDFKEFMLGIVVDEVKSVQEVDGKDITTSAVIDQSKNYDYILGVYQEQGHLTLVLDIESALSIEDRNRIIQEKKAA